MKNLCRLKGCGRRSAAYAAERKEKNTISDKTKIPRPIITRQGIAPCRGIIEAGPEPGDFFLIFGEPIARGGYFLNKLSKAARASPALRGAGAALFSVIRLEGPDVAASRATVNIGSKSAQVLA